MVAILKRDKGYKMTSDHPRAKFESACNFAHIKAWVYSQKHEYQKLRAKLNKPTTGAAVDDDKEELTPLHQAWQDAFGDSAAASVSQNTFESGGAVSSSSAATSSTMAPSSSDATAPGDGDGDGGEDVAPQCNCLKACTRASGKVSARKRHVVPKRLTYLYQPVVLKLLCD